MCMICTDKSATLPPHYVRWQFVVRWQSTTSRFQVCLDLKSIQIKLNKHINSDSYSPYFAKFSQNRICE